MSLDRVLLKLKVRKNPLLQTLDLHGDAIVSFRKETITMGCIFLGKASRILAAKLSLCSRVDALGDQTEVSVAIETKRYVEKRLEEIQDDAARGQI